MFLGSIKYYIFGYLSYLSHLELSIGSIQTVIITSSTILSNVGKKRFDCNTILHGSGNDKYLTITDDIVLICVQNIDCWYSLEGPQ